ncbi:MAG TPA: ATP-binding protein [Candidatus Aenigmarchaeota archaeon]|nr:ATP-binding protein [Candidatus Aenigmarchaeota archaeon]
MEYYPRKIEEKLDKWLKRKEFILIRGPRQAGKTTLLLRLKEKLKNSEYVTLEDPEWRDAFQEDVKGVVETFLRRNKSLLLLDEAQYIKDIGEKLKLIYDLYADKLKVIATGSGSFDVKVNVGKHLVGRVAYFELMPLSFEEFVLWKDKRLYEILRNYIYSFEKFVSTGKLNVKPVFERSFRSLLEEYIVYGGFPAVVRENDIEMKKEILKNLEITYLEKDVGFFFGVRQLEKFRRLLKFLSFNVGDILKFSTACSTVGMDYKTLENYLEVLSQTFIIDLVPPFHRNISTELRKAKKVYFFDTGLRNAILNNFVTLDSRKDCGHLLENFVWIQLRQLLDEVKFWRTTGKAEIDFIGFKENKFFPIEVKTTGSKTSKSMVRFIETYEPKVAVVFTFSRFGIERIGKTNVAFLPHFFV